MVQVLEINLLKSQIISPMKYKILIYSLCHPRTRRWLDLDAFRLYTLWDYKRRYNSLHPNVSVLIAGD